MTTPTASPAAALAALALGAALLALTVLFALRRGAGASSFGWAIVGGLAFVLMGMAGALRAPQTLGLPAAAAQLLTVVLAGILGGLCAPAAGSGVSRGGRLGGVGRFVAWLALIGLPPTPGFHAKLLLYRSLLGAGWPWAMALALGASWLLLFPALREARTVQPGPAGRSRELLVVLFLLLAIILSFYPYGWLPSPSPGAAPPVPGG